MLGDGLLVVGIYTFLRLVLELIPIDYSLKNGEPMPTRQIVVWVMVCIGTVAIGFLTLDMLFQAMSGAANTPAGLGIR